MTLQFSKQISTIEQQIHEEEVKYNEAFRMDAEFDVLKAIQQNIKHLKAQLSEKTRAASVSREKINSY
jgi:hypothetical protein